VVVAADQLSENREAAGIHERRNGLSKIA